MWEKETIKKVLINQEEIRQRCVELGAEITRDYKGKKPLVVALLRGSVPFLAELIKNIDLNLQYDFMDVSSYEGTESIGDIRIIKDLDSSIKGESIILVEDIVDTGRTIKTVVETLMNKGATSVQVVTLLDKPSRRVVDVTPDYIGFKIGILKDECYQIEE